MARWPACVAKNIANSSSAPVKGIKTRAYKEDITNAFPSRVHTPPTSPPRLLWHLPRQNQTERLARAWLRDGALGWNLPVMAVGWIPCLESFSRPWAPWVILLNSEIGEKTRHSPSPGEVSPSDWLSPTQKLSYPEGYFPNSHVSISSFPAEVRAAVRSPLCPTQPHLHVGKPCTSLSFTFSLPFRT